MPSALSRSTIARPMPRVPPVTSATLAIRSFSQSRAPVAPALPKDSDFFHAHGHAHAAANKKGGEAFGGARPLHLVQQSGKDPRAGPPEGVADGEAPAVDVHLGGI